MRLIDRYLFRQLLGPTLLATLALSLVALLSQSLSALDLIVNQRQSAATFAKVTLLAMPQLINMVLPIALFVAALVSLNRLHTEQEIVVCFAGGMSRWRVIAPAMRLASTLAFLALLLNLFVQPLAARTMREILFQVNTDLAASLVREGQFIEPAPGLTVYAQTIDSAGVMHNLFIHQLKPDGGSTTLIAEEGRMARREGQAVLIMKHGSRQEFSKAGVLDFLTFDEFIPDLSDFSRNDELVHYKPSDRYLHELLFPDLQQDWERRNHKRLLAEGHARISTPLFNIAFMSLALSAIIGGGFSRMGYNRRIAITAAAAAGTRIAGFIIQAACESQTALNVLQYALPLAVTAVALHEVFRLKVTRFIPIERPRRAAMARA